MSETTETTAQREARLQRDACGKGMAEAYDWLRANGHHDAARALCLEPNWGEMAYRRYPDPPTLTVREAKYQNWGPYRWVPWPQDPSLGGILEGRVPEGEWISDIATTTGRFLDFVTDLRAYPMVDQSGRACRQEPDGRVVYKEGA